MRFKNVMKVFKIFAISGKIIFLLIFISSINPKVCKSEGFFTPYRWLLGLKQQTITITTDLSRARKSLEENGYTGSQIYHDEGSFNPTYATLEFSPNYLFDTIGYYSFIQYKEFNFYIEDYPSKNVNLTAEIYTITFALPLFLYWGDKNLGKEGNFSFRIGYGPGFTIVNKINYWYDSGGSSENSGTSGGPTFIIDMVINYFTIKLEQTRFFVNGASRGDGDYSVHGEGGTGAKNYDIIQVDQIDTSIGFYYYF